MARRAVLVEWIDSCSLTGGPWVGKQHVRDMKPTAGTSIGFVIAESGEHITLAAHESDDQYAGEMAIPKCAIKRMTRIALPKEKKRARR